MNSHQFSFFAAAASAIILLNSCGGQGGTDAAEPAMGPIASAFHTAAAESGAPVRMIMAVGYLESRLRTEHQSAIYLNAQGPASEAHLSQRESAFGLSSETLGLAGSGHLVDQITAYGKLLKERLASTSLPESPVTPEEKMRWLYQFAAIHRGEDIRFRKLWSVFSLEMMQVLNLGFEFQDPKTDEKIILEKEAVSLTVEQMPSNYQQDLALFPLTSDIRAARFFDLTIPDPASPANNPIKIEVVHCPLAFSACLQLQASHNHSGAKLGAHYIIPNNENDGVGILQVARHNESLELISPNGNTERVTNRIVVMLAGQSGSYVGGIRKLANPLWLTDYQLNLLGLAIPQICGKLQQGYGVSETLCRSPTGEFGIRFRVNESSTYHWGDIPEFDHSIFMPYIGIGEGVYSSTTINVDGGDRSIDAGTVYTLNLQFQPAARQVSIERMVRCAHNDKVVWEAIEIKPVRGVSTKAFEMSWDDAGANGNGEQFFRAKVTGDSNKFLGWAVQKVQISNYDKTHLAESNGKECF